MTDATDRLTENDILGAGFRFAGLSTALSYSQTVGNDAERGQMLLISLWEDRYIYRYTVSQLQEAADVSQGTQLGRGTVHGTEELTELLRMCEELVQV